MTPQGKFCVAVPEEVSREDEGTREGFLEEGSHSRPLEPSDRGGSQWVGPLGDTLHIGEAPAEMDLGEGEWRMASIDLGVRLNDLSWSDAPEFL